MGGKIIRFKADATKEEMDRVEAQVKAQGGKITGRTSLTVKTIMFTVPDNTIHSFSLESFSGPHNIEAVENDQAVHTL